jgi:hypothetical protein
MPFPVAPKPEKTYNQEYASIFNKPLPSPRPTIGTIGLRSLQHLIKNRQVKSVVALDLRTGEKLSLSPISTNQSSNRLSNSGTPTLDLPEWIADFVDVFSKTFADKLPEQTEYFHTIPLEPGTKPYFGTTIPSQLSS